MSLNMVFWDVQHGSAAFIKTPTGKKLIIDLGVGSFMKPDDATFSPLWHLRNVYGVTSADALVITHPHADHLDDIYNIDLVPPRMLIAPRQIDRDLIREKNQDKDESVVNAYFELLDRFTGSVAASDDPGISSNWGVDIKFFSPPYTETNLNNYSIVTVITYAQSRIVIPGDNEPASWRLLLDNPAFVEAIKATDFFVASHHGRESGYHAELFKHFKPKLVFISDTANVSTAVTDKYYSQATGATVRHRETNELETRYCLTTRSDDFITLDCWTEGVTKNFYNVTVD
jgi:competence protein ComEC